MRYAFTISLANSIGDNRYATVDVYYEFINPDKDRTI